jgi:hypothetical protein
VASELAAIGPRTAARYQENGRTLDTGGGLGQTLALMTDARSMTGTDFQAALRKLTGAATRPGDNVGCLACDRCEGCTDCTFCSGSSALSRCNYCVDCSECTDCTQCTRSRACLACQKCVDCERCVGSAYLVRSVACNGCTYCFGCVGLSRRDFHVLNEPYDRATYFEITARLARELGITL